MTPRSIALVIALAALSAVYAAQTTPEEAAACEAEGGCAFVTLHWFRAQVRDAMAAGHKTGLDEGRRLCMKSLT